MALNLSQLLGGAGVVATRMREAEEAERVARQNQLKIEEQNRLARMKAEIARRPMPSLADVEAGAPYAAMPMFEFQQPLPQRQIAPPAPPPAPPAAPVAAAPVAPAVAPPPPVTVEMTGPAPATVPVIEGASPGQMNRAQQNYAFHALRLRDAIVGLENLRARGNVPERMIKNQEQLVERQRQQLQFAQEGLSRLVPATQAARPTPQQISDEFARIGAPAAPEPAAAAAPARAPAPAPAPAATRIAPDVQAQRDAEAARIRARELGTVARAETELTRIDDEIKRNKDPEVKNILRAERGRVDEARKLLAAAPATAAAAPVTAPPVLEPTATVSPMSQNTANAVLAATPQMLQTDPQQLSRVIRDTQMFAARQRIMAVQQRNDQAALARIYMSSGTDEGIKQGRALMADIGKMDMALMQFDKQMRDSIIYMQGMEGLQEFARTNNPARLAGVWSYFSPAPVGVQMRSDGLFDVFYNGQRSQEGLGKDQVQQLAQQAMFESAREAIAKSAALENELALKQKYGDARVNAMKDIWVAVINGQAKVAEEYAKNLNGKLTVDAANQGAWLQTPQGTFFLSKGGIVETPAGAVTPVTAQRVQIPGR